MFRVDPRIIERIESRTDIKDESTCPRIEGNDDHIRSVGKTETTSSSLVISRNRNDFASVELQVLLRVDQKKTHIWERTACLRSRQRDFPSI
jgi:hypothetical protein